MNIPPTRTPQEIEQYFTPAELSFLQRQVCEGILNEGRLENLAVSHPIPSFILYGKIILEGNILGVQENLYATLYALSPEKILLIPNHIHYAYQRELCGLLARNPDGSLRLIHLVSDDDPKIKYARALIIKRTMQRGNTPLDKERGAVIALPNRYFPDTVEYIAMTTARYHELQAFTRGLVIT